MYEIMPELPNDESYRVMIKNEIQNACPTMHGIFPLGVVNSSVKCWTNMLELWTPAQPKDMHWYTSVVKPKVAASTKVVG